MRDLVLLCVRPMELLLREARVVPPRLPWRPSEVFLATEEVVGAAAEAAVGVYESLDPNGENDGEWSFLTIRVGLKYP